MQQEDRNLWLTRDQLVDVLRRMRGEATIRQFADHLRDTSQVEITHQQLQACLSGANTPGFRIPQAIGYEAMTVYRPILKTTPKKKARKP